MRMGAVVVPSSPDDTDERDVQSVVVRQMLVNGNPERSWF